MTGPAAGEIALLRRLANLYHVQTSYVDALDGRVAAAPEALLAVLRALGAPVHGTRDVADGVRARLEELWRWRLEPVTVAWDGRLDGVELRLPAAEAPERFDVQLDFEDGAVRRHRIALREAVPAGRRRAGGEEFAALRLPLKERLPAGYHTLTIIAPGRQLGSLVVSAPRLAYAPEAGKRWGVFLPLYSLRSARSWGIGDLDDLRGLVAWAGRAGAHFVATLPLLASFLETPYEPSPYVPVSRLFWNEIFMSIPGRVTERRAGLKHDDAVLAAAVGEARRLNARATVPYREAMALKRRVLGKFTRRFSLQDPAYQAAALPAARPSTEDYARFRAAVERLGPSWRKWPHPQRTGSLTPSDYDPEAAAFFAEAQDAVRSQLLALARDAYRAGVRLYLDLPVGVHNDGYDAWRYRELFAEGLSMGAPPDPLAGEGQNWGFQPIRPEALRESGYAYARAYLQHHLEVAHMLRIDHAIGLERVFCIPEGGGGRDGVFVRQPSEEVYAILSLESHRHQAVIIGEDLGLVPPGLTKGMEEHGITGSYVQIFALTGDEARPVRPPKRRSVASWGTHDLPPFAAWWTDADLEGRVAMGLLDAGSAAAEAEARRALKGALAGHLRRRGLLDEDSAAAVFRGSLRLLAESDADWVQVNLEDTWGETRSQNVPGTTDAQHPNWRRRAAYALEEMEALPGPASAFATLRECRP